LCSSHNSRGQQSKRKVERTKPTVPWPLKQHNPPNRNVSRTASNKMPRRRIIDSDDESDNADMDVDSTNNGQQQQQQQRDVSSSSSSSSPHRSLQEQLENQAGVRPSHCWLDQCVRYLRDGNGNNSNNNNNAGAEEIWNQILHADLRDVVREERENNYTGGSSTGATAAMQLRNALKTPKERLITATTNTGNAANHPANTKCNTTKYQSRKTTLPSNFRLLVQMEEAIDVSMNGEQQLAAMGGGGGTAAIAAANNRNGDRNNNNNGPQGQGNRNPKYRCLKMALSDGYYTDGKALPSSSNARMDEEGKENDAVLMAMETSPLRNLSVSSPPGLKLLLHGPIDVRLGLLQLNDENCAVMGGEIEGWKEVWKKAKEKAQREKGLGVDPTIKALIWNPLMGDEEEADEGEGESGDVTAAAVAAVVPPPAMPPPPIQVPPPAQTRSIITPNQSSTRPNSYVPPSSQNQDKNQTPYTANVSSRGSGGNNLRQKTLDSYPKKPRPETTRLLPRDTSTTNRSRQTALPSTSNNPYQRSSIGSGKNNDQFNNRIPQRQQQQQQPQQPHQQIQPGPPPMRNNTNIIPVDDSPPSSTSHTSSTQHPPQQRANPYASLRPSTSPPSAPKPTSTMIAATTLTPPSSFTSNPSFSELKSILQSLRTDRTLYKRYHGKIITVPCKMDSGPSKVFNIVKASSGDKKKSKLKKDKKYEYLLVGQFLGPKQSDGAIACQVESTVVETYFDGYTPAEIRKLSREDKVRANRIVNQSSSQFIHDFSSLGQIEMKLLLTADNFYRKVASLSSSSNWLSDTANPFMLVVKRT